MGNHEYCVDCGESSFHYGQPCNPERLAERQAEKALQDLRVSNCHVLLERLAIQLRKRGFEATVRNDYPILEVNAYELVDKPRRRKSVSRSRKAGRAKAS